MRAGPPVLVGLLGPLTLSVDGREVDVPGSRRRTLLAVLALSRGRVLSAERLIDLTWPDDPPADALQALYNHVSRLRRDLGVAGHRLRRVGAGYALDLADDEVDVTRARALAEQVARRADGEALEPAREALALWRGPALDELRGHPELGAEAVALDELQARLVDDLTEARLARGEAGVVPDAAAAAAEHPLRERSTLLLMRALASEGRSADAMRAGAAYRARLADEAGLDPGPSVGHLEQVIASGGVAPSPSSAPLFGARPLPRPSGPLVGRSQDREEVLRLLSTQRIVTLAGPGGVGKTRLALDVAAEVSAVEGTAAVVVDLAAVQDGVRAAQAVASTLGLRTGEEVTADAVASAVGDARLLLLLDNCEHLAPACADLVEALGSRAPGVRMLVTSRVSLHARDEYVVRLQPLPVPRAGTDPADLERQPSVRAFLEHARRRDRSFRLGPGDAEPLVEVLRRLDGLPLAIELAAGQTLLLPVAAVRDRLGRALDLDGGRRDHDDDRQRTLRRTIRWSYDMLAADEQALLRALAPFPGGVDLETVESLAEGAAPGADAVRLLHTLADSSLVVVDPGRTRYRLLFTVRAFLLDELGALGEADEAELRFLAWAHRAARDIGAALQGAAEGAADARLRAELDNLRAARDAARVRDLDDLRVDITLAVDQSCLWRDLREVWAWCFELVDDPSLRGHPRQLEILGAGAEAARQMGDFDRALDLAARGLALADRVGAAATLRARCWSALAGVAHYRGDFAEAARRWTQAGRTPVPTAAGLLASAALAAAYGGDRDQAERLLADAADADALHPCPSSSAFASYVTGELTAVSDPEAAVPAYRTAMAQARSAGASFVEGVASVALASARSRVGEVAPAARAFSSLLDYWLTTGHGPQLWTTARNAASLLLALGHRREAALLVLRAEATPSAAYVDERIARHSGRTHPSVAGVFDDGELAALRREAAALSARQVVDLARRALDSVASVS
ncbi:MAG TPA: BTAD domain-containing putative transcriptional regulator [Nocardioidaceae bacterium]|nr:BTAD domain-containing putative transcriptional regulator [Nocardioidaceae bacterium]